MISPGESVISLYLKTLLDRNKIIKMINDLCEISFISEALNEALELIKCTIKKAEYNIKKGISGSLSFEFPTVKKIMRQ